MKTCLNKSKKKKFQLNDLLVVDHIISSISMGRKQLDKNFLQRIVKRAQSEIWTRRYQYCFINDLMVIAALKIFHNSFSDLTVVDKACYRKSQFYKENLVALFQS